MCVERKVEIDNETVNEEDNNEQETKKGRLSGKNNNKKVKTQFQKSLENDSNESASNILQSPVPTRTLSPPRLSTYRNCADPNKCTSLS